MSRYLQGVASHARGSQALSSLYTCISKDRWMDTQWHVHSSLAWGPGRADMTGNQYLPPPLRDVMYGGGCSEILLYVPDVVGPSF